jgi:hypothetical protein
MSRLPNLPQFVLLSRVILLTRPHFRRSLTKRNHFEFHPSSNDRPNNDQHSNDQLSNQPLGQEHPM